MLKYADNEMDFPALYDTCDMIYPVVDCKSKTDIIQFREYSQQKRSAKYDRPNRAMIRTDQERWVDDASSFADATGPPPSGLPSSSTRQKMRSSAATSSAMLPTSTRPAARVELPFFWSRL